MVLFPEKFRINRNVYLNINVFKLINYYLWYIYIITELQISVTKTQKEEVEKKVGKLRRKGKLMHSYHFTPIYIKRPFILEIKKFIHFLSPNSKTPRLVTKIFKNKIGLPPQKIKLYRMTFQNMTWHIFTILLDCYNLVPERIRRN